MMKKLMITTAVAGAIFATFPVSATETNACPDGTATCTLQSQHQGDVDNSSSADNSHSNASQSNPSSNSNASSSGIHTSYDNSAQTTQEVTSNTGDVNSNANSSSSGNKTDSFQTMGQANTGNSASTSSSNTKSGVEGSGNASQGQSVNDSGNAHQGQQQGQQQGQLQAQNVDGTAKSDSNSASGGNVIDTRNQSSSVSNVSYRTNYIPSITQATPITIVPNAHLQLDRDMVCQPRKVIRRVPREIFVAGLFGGRVRTVGTDQILEDDTENPWKAVRMPDGSTRYYGHIVTDWGSVVTSSTTAGLQLGGGRSEGSWGQGGLNGGGSLQSQQHSYRLADCELVQQVVVEKPVVKQVVKKTAKKVVKKKC